MEKEIIRGTSKHENKKFRYAEFAILGLGFLMYTIEVATRVYHYGAYFNFTYFLFTSDFISYMLPAAIIAIIIESVRAWLGSMTIVVTDKRVYGTVAFGKRVDLPLDSISAVSLSFLSGIAVATSAGKIVFNLIKNNKEIHSVISSLLVKRQEINRASINPAPKTETLSNADEIKKYKALMDEGIITEEDFENKKRQLLGL